MGSGYPTRYRPPVGNLRRSGGIALIALLGALTLTSCQTARIGAPCRTPGAWGENADQILRCQGRKWVRVISKADYARLILAKIQREQASAVQGETETRPLPPPTPPTSPPPTTPPTTVPPPTTTTTTTTPPAVSTDANTFHVLYVVPSDVTPDPTIPAAVNHELGMVSAWYRTQTSGKAPRFFRQPSGAINVETVDLPLSSADLAAADLETPTARYEVLRAHLEALGFVTGEADLVYVDFQSAVVCGEAVKDLAFVYLERPTPVGGPDQGGCGRTNAAAPSPNPADDTLVTTTHELTHAFGAVDDCAPNHDAVHEAHVNDGNVIALDANGDPILDVNGDPRYLGQDILFWNPAFYLILDDFDLDKDHLDYYGTGRTDCTDIANAPWWE
jgi:hypothetical protein